MKKCYCFFCRAVHKPELWGVYDFLTAGETTMFVSRKVGVTKSTVSRVKKDWGYELKMMPKSNLVRARAEEMLDSGMPYSEVAETLGVDRTTVADWFPGRMFDYRWGAQVRRLEAEVDKVWNV